MKILQNYTSTEILPFQDIKKLAYLITNNNTEEFLEYIQNISNIYDITTITPVIKAIYYSLIGRTNYSFQVLQMYNHLQNYTLFNPHSEKCYHDYDDILKEENIHPLLKQIKDQNKLDVCKVKPNNIADSIPHILHHIWTTSSENSEDVIKSSFIKNNVYLNENSIKTADWEHNMWLISAEVTPPAVLEILHDANYTVKFTTNSSFSPTANYIINAGNCFAEMKLYTLASNLIRFGILFDQGGVYLDGDYKLLTHIAPLADNFKFVVGYISSSIGTGFIASNKGNSFIEQTVNLNARNIDNVNTPDYVKYPCRTIDKITSSSDLTMSLIFYGNYHSYDTNEELFLPPNTVYKQQGFNPYLKCPREFLSQIKIIGEDDYQHSWLNTTKEELSYNYELLGNCTYAENDMS